MDNLTYLMKSRELYELAEQLCQSENTKRDITDVAVSKIPYVIYPDLDTNQNLIVHEFAEYCLLKAKEDNYHNEVAITYDLDNNISLENGFNNIIEKAGVCYGTVHETDIFSNAQTMSIIYRAKRVAVVNLHNHPSCSSFSTQDISLFLVESAIKLMVVVGNNGELYYLSKNLDIYNFKEAMNYFTNTVEAVCPDADSEYKMDASEQRLIADIFLKNCKKFGIEYKHVLGTERALESIKKNKEHDLHER